jgi:hypothetical protein
MPYKIFHAKNGFYVVNGKTGKRFSDHPLTKGSAEKQREAIAISEVHKKGEKLSHYFL